LDGFVAARGCRGKNFRSVRFVEIGHGVREFVPRLR